MKITLAEENNKFARIVASEGDELPARMSYAPHERDAVRAQKVRLGKRAAIGKDWDGKADNDNIAWPLATSLIREGNTELLKAAMAYRKVHDTAKSEALLGGKSTPLGKGMSLDQRTHVTASGNIAYKGARTVETNKPEQEPTMKVIPYQVEDDGIERNVAKVPRPWNGDRPVNDMIDAQGRLASLRHRLGVLVEPLEMAVVDGKTYEKIGNEVCRQAHKVPATAAGRALVHAALLAARDAMGDVRREDLAA